MTGSSPDPSPGTALATRLSAEMKQAEHQGFGTATVWLTRAEIDLICTALTLSAGRDTARLDFLQSCAAALQARTGASQAWQLLIDREHVALATDKPGRSLGIGSHPTCREAIDARLAELERARAAISGDTERAPARPERAETKSG